MKKRLGILIFCLFVIPFGAYASEEVIEEKNSEGLGEKKSSPPQWNIIPCDLQKENYDDYIEGIKEQHTQVHFYHLNQDFMALFFERLQNQGITKLTFYSHALEGPEGKEKLATLVNTLCETDTNWQNSLKEISFWGGSSKKRKQPLIKGKHFARLVAHFKKLESFECTEMFEDFTEMRLSAVTGQSLKKVHISGSRITNGGLSYFRNAFWVFKNLKDVVLEGSLLTDHSLEIFLNMKENRPQAQITFSKSGRISDRMTRKYNSTCNRPL